MVAFTTLEPVISNQSNLAINVQASSLEDVISSAQKNILNNRNCDRFGHKNEGFR